MLQIYSKVKYGSKTYVDDVDKFFEVAKKSIVKHSKYRDIIRSIDKAAYVSNDTIRTAYGITGIHNLSSGCKALLIATAYPTYKVNFEEAGDNVIELAVELSKKYNIQIVFNRTAAIKNGDTEIEFNGEKMPFNKAMCKVEN